MTAVYSTSSVTVSGGATTAVFTVKRSGTSSDLASASNVGYATKDISAVAGTDYTATSGTLSFAAGVTEATVSVGIDTDAYQGSTSKTFLFALTGFGSATGTISVSSGMNPVQIYWYVPEDDEPVPVPTAKENVDNIKHQALVNGFVGPDSGSQAEMPMGYMRVGRASANMNYYERVILNARNYLPLNDAEYTSGTTTELGTMGNQALPRGIDRHSLSSAQIDSLMADNSHLDGIFLYSNWNYFLTVGNNFNEVIQGDYVHFVGGKSRQLYMDGEGKWVYFGGPTGLRSASGMQRFAGKVWQFNISNARSLTVTAALTNSYKLAAELNCNAAAKVDVANDIRFGIANGVDIDVRGLQAALNCDVAGNFSIDTPFGGRTSTAAKYNKSVTDSITLSVNSQLSSAWTAPVVVAAGAAAAAGLLSTSGGWIELFQADAKFFQNATPDGMEEDYLTAFDIAFPAALATMSLVVSAVVLIASYKQMAATTVSPDMPKIEIFEAGIYLSCGEENKIAIDEFGIEIISDQLTMVGLTGIRQETELFEGYAGDFEVVAPEFLHTGAFQSDEANIDVIESISLNSSLVSSE